MADFTAFAFAYPNPAIRKQRLAVQEMKHYMSPYAHDVVHAWIRGGNDSALYNWDDGTPIKFHYGRAPRETTTFNGYILSVKRHWDQTKRVALEGRMMEVWAIGASYPLKDGFQAVYEGMSADLIVTRLAQSQFFNADAPPLHYVWPARYASSTTMWGFLCDLAAASGVTFYAHDTELRFYEPLTILRRNTSVVPVFYDKDFGSGALSTIISLETKTGEDLTVKDGTKRNRVVQAADASTGGRVYAVSDGSELAPFMNRRRLSPIFSEFVPDIVVRNQADANAFLRARQVANRFHIRAHVEVRGNPTITQESPLVLEGVGSRHAGIWQVLECVHHVKWHWYSTQCEIGRDSDYDTGVRPGLAANVARAQYDPANSIVYTNPGTVLVNGRWRAAYVSKRVPGAA